MTSDNDRQIIFILDDDESINKMLKEYINGKIPNLDVYTFNNCVDVFNNKLIKDCSLFIIDIELDSSIKGNEVAHELFKNQFDIPYLFMSGKDYDFECFQEYQYTYDFIKKPFNLNKLINRIAVLLKVSSTYKKHEIQEEKLRGSIKELFDHTNIYMVILDSDMNINSCSYKLAKDLEYTDTKEINGLSWKTFLPKDELNELEIIHKNVIDDTVKYQKSMREVTSKLITKTGKTITVKWFNSRIKNGSVNTFSIGMPYNRKVTPDDEIDSIRAYWKHVLDKDETTLKALKNTA